MRLYTALATFLCLLFTSWCAFAEPPASTIQWRPYSPQILAQAKKDDRLILIFAVAEWCHWCQKMKTTYANPKVVELINKNFLPIKIDIDKQKDLVKQYNVTSLPTSIFMDSNSHVINTIHGYRAAEEFIPALTGIIELNSNQTTTVSTN
jgi:thioredoxin-related protein